MFDDQKHRILNDLDRTHAAYYRAEVFGGPSLYFHLKSLEASRAQDFDRFAEYVYALLASWGMHRMGPGGSKMCDFDEFRSSLHGAWPIALQLQTKVPEVLHDSDWKCLKEVFCGIHCMKSQTSLVGNSKIMAHLLPTLVPPVDRAYTLKFLFGNTQVANGVEIEWAKLERILRGFFYPIAQSSAFRQKAEEWIGKMPQFKWDTSPLKIIDNLVIGFSKMADGETERM